MISNNTTHYPLTSVQQEIWFNQLLHPNIPLYNIGGYLRIDGPIDPVFFEKAVNQVIQDNDALRIMIHEGESLPTQTFLESVSVKLDVYDFSEQENAHQSALEWMQHEFVKPFSLYDGLLFEFALCKVSAKCYYWLKKYHHLIVDGWAISQIVQRVAAAYNTLGVKQSNAEQIHYSYLDFIQNDQAYLDSDKFTQHQRYWLDKYREVPEPLLVRRYAAQFADQVIPSQRSILHLQHSLYNQLIKFAKANNASTFHVILSVLYCYFVRTSARKDLVIGLPTLNRSAAAFKHTVGLFAGMTSAWFRFGRDLNFVELIQAIKGELQKHYRYQRFPMSEINRCAGLHAQNRQPPFDIKIAYEKHDYDAHFKDSPVEMLSFTNGFEQSAIAIGVREFQYNQNIRIEFDYNLGAFNASEMECITARLEFLLGEVCRQSSVPIHALQIMPDAELKKVLVEFNQTASSYPHDKTLVNLFEEQVDKTPEAIAVVFEAQSLTYQELNTKANQLAHYLQNCGVKPEILVGICLERSFEMVIGLLGILKAGGAYVPLDPAYPLYRLQLVLEESQVSVLLSQHRFFDRLPVVPQAQIICLDNEWKNIAVYSSENPVILRCPTNLAYVLFTSGSSGKPKGVLIEHKSVTTLIQWAKDTFSPENLAGVLASTSINFDLSVYELFVPLCQGGQVFLVENALSLPTLAQRDKITLINTVPSAITELVRIQGIPNSVKVVNLAGEPLKKNLVQALYQQTTIESVYNLYGPSEDTTYSTCSLIPKNSHREPTIGRPIANTQIYILDCYLQPLPIGVPGELHIGGIGLARGYLNRPDLTTDKFIKNPFSDDPHSRLYKTGDLARYLPDGNIEYLGRIDNQVKIRGFRIELGEIEAVIEQHPSVQQNAVIIHETEKTGKRLIACVIPQPTQTIEQTKLQAFLKKRLPDYMIPSFFVTLETMPLTPNGKIDRQTLVGWVERSETHQLQSSTENFIPPRTLEEELLAGIWTEVLGTERISIHDNFLELGGHSLLATQVISRIRDTFDIELSLQHFFDAPTIAALNEQLNTARDKSTLPPIIPINREKRLPLSFAQQRLWFLNQLEGPSATYNMPEAQRLEGLLHQPALIQSLRALVQRHESLRTIFPTLHGKPSVQLARNDFRLLIINLSNVPLSVIDSEVHRLVNEDAQRPFDLENGPLFRATLLQVSTASHVLLLNMHHIISDGWSTEVLVREWGILYEAFSHGHPSPLPPLPIQYVDYADWQRQWLTGEVLEQQAAYWKQQLAGSPALLELPTNKPRPPVQRFQGASLPLQLNAELTAKLKQLSQQTGVTLFMTLWSAFATLLCRYSGQTDIVIGSPIANRTQRQTEFLVGFFVNTLVLRLNLFGNPSFETLLQQARRVALEAYTHQDIPFDSVVDELKPKRTLSHSPLFQVMFVLQNTLVLNYSEVNLAGLKVNPLEIEQRVAKFDLTLTMAERNEALVGELEYNTDLFDSSTIERWIGHFKTLLTSLVANPQQPVHELPLLTKAEQQQLLAWNETTTAYQRDKTLVDLFEQQVNKTPEAIAVVFESQQLTYQTLNTKANQLAHYLQTLGVKPEVLVGICLERSLEMIIGLLGILKAGGAYLPLDPAYPTARLAFMLEDALVSVLLTQSSLKEKLPETIVALNLQSLPNLEGFTEYTENPVSGVKPENLAYVIYTSGSTGQSKGVLLEHRGLCNLAQAQITAFGVQPDSRILQFASLSFDVAISDIAMAFASGARLHLVAQETIRSPAELVHLLKHQSITHLEIPASVLGTLPFEDLPALQSLIVGGEACSPSLVALWSKCRRFFNAYGPTEGTVCATFFKKTASSLSSILPIGRPIANTQAYILDAYLQPLPVGIPGELHIGGIGLARSYLNRPDLTAEKFINNPFREESEARLYKTGDLARYLPEGNIEYLGRIDNQVKIRGFRIELDEIETVLAQQIAVRENAVVVHETSPTDKRLVAYIVLHPEQPIETKELHDFLKERLPPYMIPSAFFTLEALPLTPNGKVDRRELVGWVERSETHQLQPSTENFVPPRMLAEELLASIWAAVLNIKQVGVHDNFFELGGDSIISIQVISRANQAGLQLTPKQLFQHQTIAELAIVAQTGLARQAEQGLVTGAVPLTPIQHWFFEQQLSKPHHFNQFVLLKVSPQLRPEQLETIVSQLLQHHDVLRLRVLENNQQQVITDHCSLFTDNESLITIKELSHLRPTEQSAAIEATALELQASLNFETGPLLRVALFQLGVEQPSRLFVVIHHLAVDGVSWRILLEDFATAWQQLSRGENIVLPPKTTSFQQWAKHLTEYAVSDQRHAELEEWISEAHWQVKPLPVNTVAQASTHTVANADPITVSLSVEQTQALLNEVPATYQTQINDILLTALVQSFAGWTGEKLLLIDLEGHGREELFADVDLSRTVGWFTSQFPVLLDLRTVYDETGVAIKTIKEQLRQIPQHGIGYGLLRYLNSETASRLTALPQAQVIFNYLGQFQNVSTEPLLGFASEDTRSILNHRFYLLEIEGSIPNEQLQITWGYSQNHFQSATIERLAQNFITALQTLITHCQSPEVGGYTPSDFSTTELSQDMLDDILDEFGE